MAGVLSARSLARHGDLPALAVLGAGIVEVTGCYHRD